MLTIPDHTGKVLGLTRKNHIPRVGDFNESTYYMEVHHEEHAAHLFLNSVPNKLLLYRGIRGTRCSRRSTGGSL